MRDDDAIEGQVAYAGRDAQKVERRAAMAEFKRLHAQDSEKTREAARRWFEEHAGEQAQGEEETSSFHLRKLKEADPERAAKAAQAANKSAADADRAKTASRETVKQWKKRNPNKVKKLKKLHLEQHGKFK